MTPEAAIDEIVLRTFDLGSFDEPFRPRYEDTTRSKGERIEPSYPMRLIDGIPFYYCVVCGRNVKVSDVQINEDRLKGGHYKRTMVRHSATVGFKLMGIATAGDTMTKTFAPIKRTASERGWICDRH